MAFDYAKFRLLAERLIEENGRTITLVRQDQGNPADAAKPWRASTNANEITTDVIGVFTDFEKEDFEGTLIRRGDKRVLIAAKSVEDATSGSLNVKVEDFDAILDDGVRWKILTADLIEPGSSRIMYDVQVRQ